LRSFQPKDGKQNTPSDDKGNPTVDFHGEKRSNETHESKTDADAKPARKGPGKEAKRKRIEECSVSPKGGFTGPRSTNTEPCKVPKRR
jgi:hypothetical protein